MSWRDAHKFRHLARLGYAARGLIYLVIGSFALMAAFGYGTKTDTTGALEAILGSRFGPALAVALLVGFVCYVVWRYVQALVDTDDHGWTPQGIAIRLGLLASGTAYATLTVYTWSLLNGYRKSETDSNDDAAQRLADFIGNEWTARVLAAVFLGVGIAHVIKAVGTRYEASYAASERTMAFVHPVAIIGLLARAVIFCIIAMLLFYRGHTAGENGGSPGLKEALEFIQSLPAGPLLLAGMGVGLFAFALYSFTQALWRRINVGDAV